MVVKYNMNEDYFKYYDEAQDVYSKKESIKEGKKVKIRRYSDYFKMWIGMYLVFFFIIILGIITFEVPNTIAEPIILLASLLGGICVFIFASYYLVYLNNKKVDHSGELIFDDGGITDFTLDDISLFFPWSLIDVVIVSRNVIVFTLHDKKTFFFVPRALYDNVKKALKKYKKDLLLTDVVIEEKEVVKKETKKVEKKETKKTKKKK